MWKIFSHILFVVIPKKMTSFFVFPIAYLFRKRVWRSPTACDGDWQLQEVKKRNRGWKRLIWSFLDDSIQSETHKEYNTKRNNLYRWTHSDFLNAWYWNGIRNTSNNLSHWISKGAFKKVIKRIKTKHLLYEKRQFDGGIYPYLEIRCCHLVMNVGWLHSGKFEGPKIRRAS